MTKDVLCTAKCWQFSLSLIKGWCCIINNKLISIDYINTFGEKSLRIIEPMTLLFKGYSWYLFAFCNLKNDYRLFRISRIKSMEILDKEFIRRKKNYQDIMENENPADTKMQSIKLRFNKVHRVNIEDYFNDNDIEYLDNGDLIVNMQNPEGNEWIYNWILGYGDGVEVLEPESIRNAIKEKLKNILYKYS